VVGAYLVLYNEDEGDGRWGPTMSAFKHFLPDCLIKCVSIVEEFGSINNLKKDFVYFC
jgi:hypothetical protein